MPQLGATLLPIGHDAVHQLVKRRPMAVDQQMAQLVDDHVLQALGRIEREADVDADAARRWLTAAPAALHVAIRELSRTHAHHRLPLLEQQGHGRLDERPPRTLLFLARLLRVGTRRVCQFRALCGNPASAALDQLHELGVEVHSIVGFRNKDLVILEDEFRAASSKFVLMSDDGTAGEKGLVTDALKKLIESGEKYDRVITIGPLIMMKFVCRLTKEYEIPTVASMNPIMIDGTGMCGGCRLTVGGETKFACVDGPEFDGHLIDFDEAMARGAMYKPFERHAYEEACNLFKEVK